MLFYATFIALASCISQQTLFVGAVFLPNDASIPSSARSDIVDTGYARYLGNRTYPNTVAYLGIPYAEPPLGERRFRAPLPLNIRRVASETKGRVVDARDYPDFCIQGTIGAGDAGGAGSEDCLKVNIYAPAGAKRGSNLSVLVYTHGGGFTYGNPRNWPFDHWINQSPNVVVVSVYYRLSSFGFLATPAFTDATVGDFNAGFLDQVQALRWVRANIASFGGNYRKVTINGESAGGASVALHLVASTRNEGLYSAAIGQSVWRTPVPTPEEQQPLFEFYAKHAGCGEGTAPAQVACLRKASVSALARAQDAAAPPLFTGGYNRFRPVLDGKIITDYPTRSFLTGNFAGVPLIVGSTTNDTVSGGTDTAANLRASFPSISDTAIKALIDAYPLADFASSVALQLQTILGDTQFRCAGYIMGTAFSKVTRSWTYRYNQPTPGAAAVHHAAENWMMFKGTSTGFNGTTTFQPQSPTEEAFAEELIAYWLSFIRSNDPNTFKLARSPTWTEYTPTSARIVLTAGPTVQPGTAVVSGTTLEVENETGIARCKLVASQVDEQQN
ncbi:unnamed protein product [Cyclocybe aegerita]|uniref:Carboxylic ester hydrolase n=1 Tax=Cyclocybe aegerita TaxID=1973307 RepID=A0A8S0VS38_CYCAE|nr:unnamed protein product [Cyclocybe aegerita]